MTPRLIHEYEEALDQYDYYNGDPRLIYCSILDQTIRLKEIEPDDLLEGIFLPAPMSANLLEQIYNAWEEIRAEYDWRITQGCDLSQRRDALYNYLRARGDFRSTAKLRWQEVGF